MPGEASLEQYTQKRLDIWRWHYSRLYIVQGDRDGSTTITDVMILYV